MVKSIKVVRNSSVCTIESRGSHISREQVSLSVPRSSSTSLFIPLLLYLSLPYLSANLSLPICFPLPTQCPLPFLSFVLGSFVNRLFVIAFGPTNELTRSSVIPLLVSPSFIISLFLLLICRDVLARSLLVAFD